MIRRPLIPRVPPAAAFALSPILILITTWALSGVQTFISGLDHASVRPFSIGYVLPIAMITLIGGKRPGYLTVGLSVLATIWTMLPPDIRPEIRSMADWMEIFFLLTVGLLLVIGLNAVYENIEFGQKAAEAEARLRAIMDTAPVAVLLSDARGNLTYANQEAERLWGKPFKRVGPDNYHEFGMRNPTGEMTKSSQTGLMRALAGEEGIVTQEREIVRPDNTRVWVDSRSTAIRNAQGKVVQGLCVFSDMTERKLKEDELKMRAQRERAINAIGTALRATFDPNMIRSAATQNLADILGAERCFFTIYDAADAIYITAEYCADDLPPLEGRYERGQLQIDAAQYFLPGQPVVSIPDIGLTSVAETGTSSPIRSLLSAPLYVGDQLKSALTVAMTTCTRHWTEAEAALVEEVLDHARAAIDAANIRRREQKIASTLQEALLPTPPMSTPGIDTRTYYQAALSEANVGGDFYDIYPVEKNCYALVIGDISGKGLAAASQVATVRNMLKFALTEGRTLSQAVSRLNSVLCEHGLLSGFVTLFVGALDTGVKTLTYVSAGHEPTLIRRSRTGEVEELVTTGPPLGVVDEQTYGERVVNLSEGDVVLLYTDGLTDAGPDRRTPLGIDGIKNILGDAPPDASATAADFMRHVVSAAREFSPAGFHDDLCLVTAQLRSQSTTHDSALGV